MKTNKKHPATPLKLTNYHKNEHTTENANCGYKGS